MIVKLVFCVRRKPEFTREEFQRYWLDEHGHISSIASRSTTGPSSVRTEPYRRDSRQRVGKRSRGTGEPYDGITEVWIDDESLGLEPTPEFIEGDASPR